MMIRDVFHFSVGVNMASFLISSNVRTGIVATLLSVSLTAFAGMHQPPSLDSAPGGSEGELIRLGHQLVINTPEASPEFGRNGLKCASCHLEEGRQPWAAPLWAAWAGRATEEGSFAQAVDSCFTSALGAKAGPGAASRETAAISAYAKFLAGDLPPGVSHEGRRLKMIPGIEPGTFDTPRADDKRGETVYARECVACHGADGAGNETAPALWGARSYSTASPMMMICCSSAFIKSFMPKGKADLSEQDALDVGAYVNSQPRLAPGSDAGSDQGMVSTLKAYAKKVKKFIKQQLFDFREGIARLLRVVYGFFGISQ